VGTLELVSGYGLTILDRYN